MACPCGCTDHHCDHDGWYVCDRCPPGCHGTSAAVPNERGVWYKQYTTECPLCGRGRTERTRMPAPKPADPAERYEFEQVYDWCDG